VLLTVLARDEAGAETPDPRRTLRLTGCSRLAASYRAGTWDDSAAPVIPLDVGGHHLTLFQDLGGVHHLDLRVWFADVSVVDGAGHEVDLDAFIADGVRWWEAMYADERSDRAPSIVGLAPEPRRRWRGWFRRTPR
jgi:hypothetical protein